jgi:segregation and condensation protein A
MPLSAASALRFKLPVFEGPLDLLLHLIRENRIDIYDIPIAEITQQYLEYLALWEALDLAIAGEYLVMAATLLEIKSRMLLPQPPPEETGEEEEDPRAELVQRLLEYQKYQGTVETLREWEEYRRQLYFRGALENPDDYLLPLSEGVLNAGALLDALKRLLASAGVDEEPVTAVVPRRRVNLRMKMAEVLRKVRAHFEQAVSPRANAEGLGFEALFELPCYRYDIVLTFLALLELLRLGRVRAEQRRPLGEITLFPAEAAAA